MIFEYLLQKIRILKSYLGKQELVIYFVVLYIIISCIINIYTTKCIGEKFNNEDIQANFTLIYELMDETMDFGYPQVCATENLKQFISGGEAMMFSTPVTKSSGAQLTSQITGIII